MYLHLKYIFFVSLLLAFPASAMYHLPTENKWMHCAVCALTFLIDDDDDDYDDDVQCIWWWLKSAVVKCVSFKIILEYLGEKKIKV